MERRSSLCRCDPRRQIVQFFDEVAREGGEVPTEENPAASPLAQPFHKATVFTAWKPAPDEGVATGKGLDIKETSAKRGNIHKEEVEAFLIDGTERDRNEPYDLWSDKMPHGG